MRRAVVLVLAGSIAVLAGCVGDTSPATNVRAHQADLHAYGHTNNGPAYWWWEWGTTRKAVANGQGTKTPKQGPASTATDITLTRTLTGLDRDQTYYFRACGQDSAAGSTPGCGRIYTFGTASGDTNVFSVYYGVRFFAASDVRHALTVSDGPGGASHIRVQESLDPSTTPPTGSALIPGDSCNAFATAGGISFDDTVDCTPPEHFLELDLADNDDFVNQLGTSEISASLQGGNDYYSGYNAEDSVSGGSGKDTIYGYGSADVLWGDDGNDYLSGGTGNEVRLDGGLGDDRIDGNDGDDLIYDPWGNNTVDCGAGTDTYYTDTVAHFNASVGCEIYQQANPGAARQSSEAAKAAHHLN